MRRLAVFIVLACVTSLGFGAAFVVASSRQGTPTTGAITICHAGEGTFMEKWTEESPDASGIIGPSGHAQHPYDIIPPFYYYLTGDPTLYFYPGLNMNTVYTGGYTGAEVLANGCVLPTSSGGITSTVTTTVTQPTTITQTVPGTTVTEPAETVTVPVTITISTPAHTVTVPGTTTVVTVPSGQTTTVTLPGQTTTLPGVTETLPGETVDNPPYTVTQPGTTTTITGGTSTTVVTVKGPPRTVEGGVLAAKTTVVTVTEPENVIHVPRHIIHTVLTRHTVAKKFIVMVVRACQSVGVGKG